MSFNYQNNTQLLHKVVFAHIKETTQKKWSLHQEESDFAEAVEIAQIFLSLLKQELSQKNSPMTQSKVVYFPTQNRSLHRVIPLKKQGTNDLSILNNQQINLGENWIAFSRVDSQTENSSELQTLIKMPEPLARYILDNCGIPDSLAANFQLDQSIIPAFRKFYSRVKQNSDDVQLSLTEFTTIHPEELLSYIVTLGKQLQTHKILVHQLHN